MLLALSANAFAQKQKTVSPLPAPVKYKTLLLTDQSVEVYGINSGGSLVGRTISTVPNQAFFANVNASTGAVYATDMNALGSPWVDLATDAPVVGWRATGANGINDLGHVVGAADDGNGYRRAFIYMPDPVTDVWTFYLLPPAPGESAADMVASDVNNFGDVVGRRFTDAQVFTWNAVDGTRFLGFTNSFHSAVNDFGIVISDRTNYLDRMSYRYDLGSGGLDLLAGISTRCRCLNALGTIAGEQTTGTKSIDMRVVRFDLPSLDDLTVIAGTGTVKEAYAIDSLGSVLYYKRELAKNTAVHSLLLKRSGASETINVLTLADQKLNYQGAFAVMSDVNLTTDPNATGFGIVATSVSTSTGSRGPTIALIPQLP